jgi:hypothetical protein
MMEFVLSSVQQARTMTPPMKLSHKGVNQVRQLQTYQELFPDDHWGHGSAVGNNKGLTEVLRKVSPTVRVVVLAVHFESTFCYTVAVDSISSCCFRLRQVHTQTAMAITAYGRCRLMLSRSS